MPALAHVLSIKSQRLTLAAIFWERSNSCICGQRYYSLGRMEIYVRSSSVPSFPDWLKWEAIREQAKELWEKLPTEKDPAKAQQVLEQLITNPLMNFVWGELYKKNRINHKSTGQYKYPACVTNVSRAARMRRRAAEVRQKGGKESEAKGWESAQVCSKVQKINLLIRDGLNKIVERNCSCVAPIGNTLTSNRYSSQISKPKRKNLLRSLRFCGGRQPRCKNSKTMTQRRSSNK